ncbi:MAG TPA: hypothetical protein VL742_15395 [Casimicrobiaceae bacterium]|nr:hypothetical protein [Casimicrobiaceae bacterium]
MTHALPSLRAMPAAERDPRPLLTRFVYAGFDIGVRALYRTDLLAPADFDLPPGTLVVSNHQRDSDVPILAVALDRSTGAGLRFAPLFFASREDLLGPRFLAALAERWPRPLRALLGTIPLGWLFAAVRAKPMRRIREFTLREAARSLTEAGYAEVPCATLLNERGLREVGEHWGSRALCLVCEDRGAPLDAIWGLRRLKPETRAALRAEFRATIARQLCEFAGLLDAGHCLYFAPEGATSEDGRFGRVREGARGILRLAARPHPVLPLALSYDALAPGRLRVVVHVGALLTEIDPSRAETFADALRRSITRLYPINASHLIARYLTKGPARFATDDLAAWLERGRTTVVAAGYAPDPLLAHAEPRALAEERLQWLRARGIVARESTNWHSAWPRRSPAGWRRPASVVRYLANALADLAPELDRTLGQ